MSIIFFQMSVLQPTFQFIHRACWHLIRQLEKKQTTEPIIFSCLSQKMWTVKQLFKLFFSLPT